jgi:hypothetical protein
MPIIERLYKPHYLSSVVHKHSEEKDDWQRNADEPKPRTFSQTHDSLQFMLHFVLH